MSRGVDAANLSTTTLPHVALLFQFAAQQFRARVYAPLWSCVAGF